jgi:SAM-dependent methyltransferase
MDKKLMTVATYNRSASALAQKFNTIGGRVEDIERAFSFVKKSDPFVFEIGCGNGRDAVEILSRTTRYLGIDISEAMIDLARLQAPGGHFAVADIEQYGIPDGVDMVFAFASLLHVSKDSFRDIMMRLRGSMAPGGIVFVSLKNAAYDEVVVTDQFGSRAFYWYTPDLVKELAGEYFEVVWGNEHYIKEQKWLEMIFRAV